MTLDSDHPGTYAVTAQDRARWRAEEAAARLWSYVSPGVYRHTSGLEVVLVGVHAGVADWRIRSAGELSAQSWPTCLDAQAAAATREQPASRGGSWRPVKFHRGRATDVSRLADECVAAGLGDADGAIVIVQRLGSRLQHARQAMERARVRSAAGSSMPERILDALAHLGGATVAEVAAYLDETSDSIGNLISKLVGAGKIEIVGERKVDGRGRPRKIYRRAGR
jgi:DNA-binding transcriptional ArsR family regulator